MVTLNSKSREIGMIVDKFWRHCVTMLKAVKRKNSERDQG